MSFPNKQLSNLFCLSSQDGSTLKGKNFKVDHFLVMACCAGNRKAQKLSPLYKMVEYLP